MAPIIGRRARGLDVETWGVSSSRARDGTTLAGVS